MSETTRPAQEAEGRKAEAVGREADGLGVILAADKKAARILAQAEAARVKAEAASKADDAEAARLAKAELAQAEIALRKAETKMKARQAKAEAREVRRNKAKAQAREARQRMAAQGGRLLDKVRSEAAASYSAFVYLVVVSVAFWSQREVFKTQFGWNAWTATLAAIFIEGLGLAFYATSVSMRLQGRSGWIPRLLAWLVTGFAAYIQYYAHRGTLTFDKPLLSYALAAASVAALLLAEVRTAHKVGRRLEELDQKDRPQARLGVRFCLRYPAQAWWAVSAMIAIPSIRTRTRALRAGRLIRHLRQQKALNELLMREAVAGLKVARKAKASEAILVRLEELAFLGLEGLRLQNQIEAAPATVAKAEAEEAAEKVAAKAEQDGRPKAERKAEAQRPTPRPKARAQEAGTASKAEAEAGGAAGTDLDLVWAGRPGGLIVWTDRLAELAQAFPGDAEAIPGRATVIATMKEKRDRGEPLRHAWTNKGWVTWAMADLRALRKADKPDPQPQKPNRVETPDSF